MALYIFWHHRFTDFHEIIMQSIWANFQHNYQIKLYQNPHHSSGDIIQKSGRHTQTYTHRGSAKENGCTCHLASKHEIVTGQFWNLIANILMIKSCHQNSKFTYQLALKVIVSGSIEKVFKKFNLFLISKIVIKCNKSETKQITELEIWLSFHR